MWLRRLLFGPILIGFIALAIWAAFFRSNTPHPSVACHFGAYLLSDGRLIGISATDQSRALRFFLMNGETGRVRKATTPWTGFEFFEGGKGWASDAPVLHRIGFEGCDKAGIRVALNGGQPVTGTRLAFDTTEVEFTSHGLRLAGRLVMPPGSDAVPIAVLVHGSERSSALLFNRFQHIFPANGIGVFVYDKRGTGKSEGNYTQDFHLLSDDANAALAAARKVAGPRALEVGFEGGSQAGWVIPLAASKAKADFLVVGYGLAEGPIAEDREEVFDDLRRAGFGEDVIAQAREITDATATVMSSDFTKGFEALDAVRAKYGSQPWYKTIKGEYSGDFLSTPNWLLKLFGPFFDVGTSWEYKPLPALERYQGPHLWVLAGDDTVAPSENTFRILKELQPTHSELDVALFPKADHGIIETTGAGDARKRVRFADGYFSLLVDWIRTKRLPVAISGAEVYPGSNDLKAAPSTAP